MGQWQIWMEPPIKQNGGRTAVDSGRCPIRRRCLEPVRRQRHAANGPTVLFAITPWMSFAVPSLQTLRRPSSRLHPGASQQSQVGASLLSSPIEHPLNPCRRHRRELSADGATAPTWPGRYRAPVATRCHHPTSCTTTLWKETSSFPSVPSCVKEEDARESAFWCC